MKRCAGDEVAFYHPATNGCEERLPRTFKNTFRKMKGSGSLNEKLNKFLFTYRITPQSTPGVSPAELNEQKIKFKT